MRDGIMTKEELTKNIYEAMQIPYLSERHDAVKQLISDIVEELLPPYQDEDTERERGCNDVLDVVATRKGKLLGE